MSAQFVEVVRWVAVAAVGGLLVQEGIVPVGVLRGLPPEEVPFEGEGPFQDASAWERDHQEGEFPLVALEGSFLQWDRTVGKIPQRGGRPCNQSYQDAWEVEASQEAASFQVEGGYLLQALAEMDLKRRQRHTHSDREDREC